MLYYISHMRTTIELTDEQRACLLEIAGRRGEKGFSHLVREAVDRYLKEEASRSEKIVAARSVLGSFSDEEAEAMQDFIRMLRSSWRCS